MGDKYQDKTSVYLKQHLVTLATTHVIVGCLTIITILPFYVWADLITVSGLLLLFAMMGAMLRTILE